MPLSRHRVANEYSLGGRDLYKGADQHDPEAVLDGVAMAGLVGVLRQLGDLAELSAQVFHGLYDEVMTTSARGHGLMLRVQQLESELPLVEKDSCQIDYLYVASNRGADWHANPRVDHGVVTRGDTPRFIMESIKQCHGPPRLFMLDKYDIGGEGTCLKRYTDPAFFKTDSTCSSMLQEGIRRERRPLRAMEIRPNLQNFEIFRPPNAANNDSKLETGLSGEASDEVSTRRRQLKYRQLNGSVIRSFRPQMQNLYEKASSEEKPSMDQSEVQISFTDSPDTTAEERDIIVDTSSSMDRGNNGHGATVHKNRSMSEEALSRSSDAMSAESSKGYNSEVDIYVDALTTADSEVETDSEQRDHEQRAFSPLVSGKACSDAPGASVSMSSSFSEKEDLPMPCSSDVGSANGDKVDHYEEIATVSIPQDKPVAGEHERTSSLEQLFGQEKPVSCEHERTNSLEELLKGVVLISEPDMRESDQTDISGIFSNATPDDTVASTKRATENNTSTISLKKTASRRSKYVGGMELFASKVGILPRKLSKKQDPFSDSLRNMAKEVLELKCDGTQVTDLYDIEANGEECDMKCLELPHPPVEKEDSVRHSVSSDSHQDDVSSRECYPEEVNQDFDHDVPYTDSPQDSVHYGNVFQHANIVTSQSPQEEECDGAAPDEKSSAGMLDLASELIQEQVEEVVSENASDMDEELKEVCIYEDQVNAENAEECSESDEYASDDGNAEYIEELVVPDGVISSLISSEQSDDACRIIPLTLTDDTVPIEGANNYAPEMEDTTLMEAITEIDLSKVVTETVIRSEAAVPDNEQYRVHTETCLAQDSVLGSCEVINQNEELQLCSPSVMASVPYVTGNTEEINELHQPVHQEPYASDDENTEHIEEQVVPMGVVCSLISSEQFDDPCHITPLTTTEDNVESESANNHTPEMEPVTLMETIAETDLPIVVTEPSIMSESTVPDNEQYNVHPEISFARESFIGSCEVKSRNEELQLCSSSMVASTPDLTGNTEEIHELHQPIHQEPFIPCNSSSAEFLGDPVAPDSRDVPLPNISSFDWMLKGTMLQSLNVLPAKPTYGIPQGSGSSEGTGDAQLLPPLPPMQWRTGKLQTGSTPLFAKLGRPPRPKPPVKRQKSESTSSLDATNEEAENIQKKTQQSGFIPQKEMAQTTVSNEVQTNPLLEMDAQENHLQQGYKEYGAHASNLFSVPEVKSAEDVASVEGDKHTLQLPELIVIPEEAWSELIDIKPILQQDKERKHELLNGFSDCNSMHTTGFSSKRTTVERVRYNQKHEELSVADGNTLANSEESKQNGLPCQNDTQNADLPVRQEDVEHGISESGDEESGVSSALEEELAKLAPDPVPEPPKYPLLQVTSHDRSMLRKAPTLVQPSIKVSDEKNSMLEQIKNKSFSLKPVLAKRPNVMGGPRTNLQVAAILQRANAIRQAVADDDDEDSWSE